MKNPLGMMLLAPLALLVSFSAAASDLSWSQLRDASGDGLELVLRQSVSLGQSQMSFAAGSAFEFEGEIPLDDISVVLFEMRAKNCTDPSAEQSDMELILPEGSDTGRDRRVGVTLQAGCLLSFFAENADYGSVSVFSSR